MTPAFGAQGTGGLVNSVFLYRGPTDGYTQNEVDLEWVWGLGASGTNAKNGSLQVKLHSSPLLSSPFLSSPPSTPLLSC